VFPFFPGSSYLGLTSTMGVGFKTSSTQNNVTFSATSGVQGTFTPTSIKASAEVVKIEVKTTQPKGIFSGVFRAEALTASARAGLEGDLIGTSKSVDNKTGTVKSSSSSVVAASVGAEAHIAKTTVGFGIQLGPVRIELAGSVGVGAAATAQVDVSKKGFAVSASGGAGATVGVGLKVNWDSDRLDQAIQTATKNASQPQPKVTPAAMVATASAAPAATKTQTWVDRKLADSPPVSSPARTTISTPAIAKPSTRSSAPTSW